MLAVFFAEIRTAFSARFPADHTATGGNFLLLPLADCCGIIFRTLVGHLRRHLVIPDLLQDFILSLLDSFEPRVDEIFHLLAG